MSQFMNLMPTINPNLEEVVIDGENTPLTNDKGEPKKKPTHNQVFSGKGKSKKKHIVTNTEERKEENVKLSVNNKDLPQAKIPLENQNSKQEVTEKPKKTYPHLVKARAKAAETRRIKREAKEKAKELAKQEKLAKSQSRRELREAKNRERARENYHKKKDIKRKQKEQKVEKIQNYDDEELIEKVAKVSVKNGEFNYEKFAKYMFQYEQDKKRYESEKQEVEKVIVKDAKKSKPKPESRKGIYKSRNIKIPPRNNERIQHPPNYLSFYKQRRNVEDLF